MAADEAAIGGGRDLHAHPRAGRLARRPAATAGMDGGGGVETLRAAAEQNGIAGFDGDGGGISADIGPAFINHAEHAERLGHAADHQPVRPGPFRQRAAERVGQVGDLLQSARHGFHTRLR